MFRSRCLLAGGALMFLALLNGRAMSEDRFPEAQDSYDVSRERDVDRSRRGDGRFVPPAPLFDQFGDDDDFLDGGGGISTDPDVYFTDEREEFLEDGGGISGPDRKLRTLKFRRPARDRGWHDPLPARFTHRTSGSFTVVYSDLGDRRHLPTLPVSLDFGPVGLAEGPKVIDVASESLDRRPIPASGIEVIHAGGAKIIRIAQDYDRTATGAIGRSADEPSEVLEPWSPGWLSWCSRAYSSFDPDFGTYRGNDGRSRFCTGDD
ncbi:BA14K family protein [Aurantimonas endophytica]|uniref:Lectin-like protein BA14k n=1 Tax=Aurantimonas endophytica TaxID=1522175 RepID=A0A7W6HBZ7_9HYPH|nr:BA14K family protein [Aurantimonas endophytica]MBB4002379.1 hypothetical protein [Aurantimonas endophytica]